MSQTARAYDGGGREHVLPEATEDVVVNDAAGVPRKVIAGQPVPLDLLDAYNEIGGVDAEEPAEASPKRRQRGRKPQEEEAASESEASDEAAAVEPSDEAEAGGDA